MRFPALRRARAAHRYDDGDDFERWDFVPGERAGPPIARSKSTLPGLIVLLMLLGGGWVLIGQQTTWPEWLPAEVAALLSATTDAKPPQRSERAPARAPVSALPPRPELPPAQPVPSSEPAMERAVMIAPAPAPPQAADEEESAPEPLPPPAADPADPYQMRAAAVGLHPQISRVLLMKLSAADYRNAGIAIERALAETPDDGAFVWPQKREPGLAVFRVHFVRGAAADCRRYVVTVAKDGWLTTAPPMERCGLQPPRPQRQ
jgi:hypothetical protein